MSSPLYPRFRVIALIVAMPVAGALLWPLDVLDAITLALGFVFAFAVELTGLHVARRDELAAARRAQAAERERATKGVWGDVLTTLQETDEPSLSARPSSREVGSAETPADRR